MKHLVRQMQMARPKDLHSLMDSKMPMGREMQRVRWTVRQMQMG